METEYQVRNKISGRRVGSLPNQQELARFFTDSPGTTHGYFVWEVEPHSGRIRSELESGDLQQIVDRHS